MKKFYIAEKEDLSTRDPSNFHLSLLKNTICLDNYNSTSYYVQYGGKIKKSLGPIHKQLLKGEQENSPLAKLYFILNLEAYAEWNRLFK